MGQAMTQSLVLIPGWSSEGWQTFRYHQPLLHCRLFMPACVLEERGGVHQPAYAPIPVSLQGRRLPRAESTLSTADTSHQGTRHSEQTLDWDQSALFLPWELQTDDTNIDKVLLGNTLLLSKGAGAGTQPGYVLTAAAPQLALQSRDKDILRAPSTET